MTTRRLRTWRWSAHTKTLDVAGELVAGDAREALELVAGDQGGVVRGFQYWWNGGIANCRDSAGEDLTVVVVAFGPAPKGKRAKRTTGERVRAREAKDAARQHRGAR